MKPVVDRLEEQYPGKLKIVRVDIQSTAGETIAREFGLFLTPSFLLFDAQGKEVARTAGSLDVNRVRMFVDRQQ